MKEAFNFSQHYYKLDDAIFTTIRGSSAGNDYKIGQTVKIKVKRKMLGEAKIMQMERVRIKDIPLSTLKTDGEYPDRIINSHQDFIDLLNEFRRFNFISSVLQFVTIFKITWL